LLAVSNRPAKQNRSGKSRTGNAAVTDGPFLEAKEYVGGFWVLNFANMDEGVAWGKKAGLACRTPVEVRAFLEMPSE
jgi:hypothetical protein